MNLARAAGLELTGADLQEIAQTAYQDWVVTLDLPMRSFFELAQQSAELNQELKQCQTPADALAKPTGGNRFSYPLWIQSHFDRFSTSCDSRRRDYWF
jgi:hypothetical protein